MNGNCSRPRGISVSGSAIASCMRYMYMSRLCTYGAWVMNSDGIIMISCMFLFAWKLGLESVIIGPEVISMLTSHYMHACACIIYVYFRLNWHKYNTLV